MKLDDLETLFVDADPALDTTIPSASSAEARWRYVQITADRAGRIRSRRRIVVSASSVAAVAAALMILLVKIIPGPAVPKSAAATVLEQAAIVAGRQNNQPAPGQSLYTETETRYQVTIYNPTDSSGDGTAIATAQFDATDQAWTNTGNAPRFVQTDGGLQFRSATDEANWNASSIGPSMTQNVSTLFGEGIGQSHALQSLPNVSDLPTDPNTLVAAISNGDLGTSFDLIPPGPNATFERAAFLLVGPDVGMTPRLSTALFHLLADQPGVKLIGSVTDHDGQQGEAVELTGANAGQMSEVVIDPTTGSVLEVDFAVDGAVAQPGGQTCRSTGSGSSLSCTRGAARENAVLAPMWTDLVSTGVVSSGTQTLPPAGGVSTPGAS